MLDPAALPPLGVLSREARLLPPAPTPEGDSNHRGLVELLALVPGGAARNYIPKLWSKHEEARRIVARGEVPPGYPAGLSPQVLLDRIDMALENEVYGVVDEGTMSRLIDRKKSQKRAP